PTSTLSLHDALPIYQRAGVADAGRAAVADEVEAELVQVRRQTGALVVVRDDLRAGRQRRLDPRLAGQALLDGLLRQQRRADHDRDRKSTRLNSSHVK